jgi:signal peptidase
MSFVRKITLMLVAGLCCAITVAGVQAWHSGYRLYIVDTGSMSPALVPGDVALDGPAKGNYHPGEIITFRHSDLTTDVVTHRITDLQSGVIHTKGDANRTADVWGIRPNQVQGVYVLKVSRLGYLLIFLRQPAGVVLVAGLLALIFGWGFFFPSSKKKAPSKSAHEPRPSALPTQVCGVSGSVPQAAGRLPHSATQHATRDTSDGTAGPTAAHAPESRQVF